MDNLTYILIGVIILFIVVIIFLLNKTSIEKQKNNTANKKIEKLNNDLKYLTNEIARYKEQVKIYEKEELERKTVSIWGKEVKKKFIYKGKRVLIGDYMEDLSLITMRLLESFGVIVDVVRSGTDIVDRVSHGYKYDLIFTNNVYKHGESGPNTLNELRQIKNFNTPVVIHTISDNKRNYFINELGFDEYVVKPLNQEKIKKVLDKFLKRDKQ